MKNNYKYLNVLIILNISLFASKNFIEKINLVYDLEFRIQRFEKNIF